MVTGVVPSPPRLLPIIFMAHRVQQSHCSSIFHGMLLTHAFALSANQFVHKKKSPQIYTSMHSGGFELTKLTYTTLEDNLIRHRGDRLTCTAVRIISAFYSITHHTPRALLELILSTSARQGKPQTYILHTSAREATNT